MSQALLMSMRDAVDILDDFVGGTAQAATQRDIRTVIQRAYINILKTRKWRSLQKETGFVTQAPFNDGTVQYFSATNTLVLTPNLSTGWPSWANQGSVLIQNVISDIISVNSDGVTANLDPVLKPDGDIAAGTAFQLFQDQFLMPADFRLADMPVAEGFLRYAQYCEPQTWMEMRRIRMSSGTPVVWTLLPSTRYLGMMVMGLAPWPDSVMSERFIYTGRGRAIVFTGYGDNDFGTFDGNSSSNAVTSTNNTFTPQMVGSLFRTRPDNITPDGPYGLNPFLEQRSIIQYVSPTQIKLDANLQQNYTNGSYVISDPIDMPAHLIEAFICEAQYTLAVQRKMTPQEVAKARDAAALALVQAQSADAPVAQRRNAYTMNPWLGNRRIARMPLGPDIG